MFSAVSVVAIGFTRMARNAPGSRIAALQSCSVGKAFVENPGGESDGAGGAEKLKGLRERDSDFADGDIIQNMGERDTGHG